MQPAAPDSEDTVSKAQIIVILVTYVDICASSSEVISETQDCTYLGNKKLFHNHLHLY